MDLPRMRVPRMDVPRMEVPRMDVPRMKGLGLWLGFSVVPNGLGFSACFQENWFVSTAG